MIITIHPHKLCGCIEAVSSKSYFHRILILSALADKPTVIRYHGISDDVRCTMDALRKIGAKITENEDFLTVYPLNNIPQNAIIDCMESGSTLRFMMCLCAALGIETEFICRGRLAERPIDELKTVLSSHGIRFDGNYKISGKISSGRYDISANVSSQYLTGLLLALGFADGASEIILTSELESSPYVDITVEAMKLFGAKVRRDDNKYIICGNGYSSPKEISVEGDYSSSAFWLAAGCTVTGLNPKSVQGDSQICDILRQMGASTDTNGNSVAVLYETLDGIELSAKDIPDLVPVVSLISACSNGISKISGVKRLVFKESNRIESVLCAIRSLGGKAEYDGDDILTVYGTGLPGGKADSYGDHRIAMAVAVASIFCKYDVIIENAEAVTKSYPNFWNDFVSLGGEIEIL